MYIYNESHKALFNIDQISSIEVLPIGNMIIAYNAKNEKEKFYVFSHEKNSVVELVFKEIVRRMEDPNKTAVFNIQKFLIANNIKF